MEKKNKNFGKIVEGDFVDPVVEQEQRDAVAFSILMAVILVVLGFIVGCCFTRLRERPQPTVIVDYTFTIKGATTVDTEIDDEVHRLICHYVEVSEFRLSESPEEAEMIGREEVFTKFLQPDGTVAYYATYYEQLDGNKGLEVKKEFMDCGSRSMVAGQKTPLTVEFCPGAGYYADILDRADKRSIPMVTFE